MNKHARRGVEEAHVLQRYSSVEEAQAAFASDRISAAELEQVIHRLEFSKTTSPIVLHRDLPAERVEVEGSGFWSTFSFAVGLILVSCGVLVPGLEAWMLVLGAGLMGVPSVRTPREPSEPF